MARLVIRVNQHLAIDRGAAQPSNGSSTAEIRIAHGGSFEPDRG